MKNLSDAFTSLDAFGRGFSFTIKGREKFGTLIGTVLTLAIYAVILVYAHMKMTKLIDRLDTVHQTTINENEIQPDDKFTFEEL